MVITLFMVFWIWLADNVLLFLVTPLLLCVRSLYTKPRLGTLAVTGISAVSFFVTLAFWLLATGSYEVALVTALRASLTSAIVARSYLGADGVLTDFTVRVPLLRTCLFFFSRWLSSVVEILDDIRYAHSVERRRGGLPRLKLLVFSFGAAATELVDLIERLLLVIFARGKYPNLRKWFTPWPVSYKVIVGDAILICAVLGLAQVMNAQGVAIVVSKNGVFEYGSRR